MNRSERTWYWAERLKSFRLAMNWSIDQMAREMAITSRELNDIELHLKPMRFGYLGGMNRRFPTLKTWVFTGAVSRKCSASMFQLMLRTQKNFNEAHEPPSLASLSSWENQITVGGI